MEKEAKVTKQEEQREMASREKQLEKLWLELSCPQFPPGALETLRAAHALLGEWKRTAEDRDIYIEMIILMRDGCTYPCAYRQTHFGTRCLCKDVLHDVEGFKRR